MTPVQSPTKEACWELDLIEEGDVMFERVAFLKTNV